MFYRNRYQKNPHKNGIFKSTSVTGNNIYLLKKELSKHRLFCFRDEFKLKQYMTFENRIFEIIPTTQSKLHFHSYDKTFFITGTSQQGGRGRGVGSSNKVAMLQSGWGLSRQCKIPECSHSHIETDILFSHKKK